MNHSVKVSIGLVIISVYVVVILQYVNLSNVKQGFSINSLLGMQRKHAFRSQDNIVKLLSAVAVVRNSSGGLTNSVCAVGGFAPLSPPGQ